MKLKTLILVALVIAGLQSHGQYANLAGGNMNVITTAVPFLLIAPDARAGAMGDAGVSSSPDIYSMHWNPAKYAVFEKDMSIGLAYSPWLRNLVPDMNLAYLAFHKRINDMSAFAATLRYFSLGDITFTDHEGTELSTYTPNEWAVDATYSRKLTEKLSGAVAARFIYSNLTLGQYVDNRATGPGISIAADVAVYWEDEVNWFRDIDAKFAWGVNISNIGSKTGYSKDNLEKKDFIPTNLRFGPTLTLELDDYNSLAFSIDINKLLVPTPPRYGDSLDPYKITAGMSNDVSVVTGMIQSFYDAPDGFSEEMRELSFAVGTEYWYNKVFALRGGFFYEDKSKGNRKFFTLGAGLRYNVFGLDFSYLIPIDSRNNPLQNTIRFALTFDLGNMSKKTE
ncbi:MAG: type IX secretion system outer membrane channel protein PorV [Bacteroidales bacterium]|nr:type IX secretion system outer membrane channel protein PorV [Bacteroidales bacterium]HOI31460.1 type IX secretion system outer membrane channel protein PorV [Bacteroidales bacterium]